MELSEIAQGDLVTAAVLVASKERGLEVIADKTGDWTRSNC
jgi:hypothetical protein